MKDVKEFATYVAQHLFDEEPEMAETCHAEVTEVTKNNGNILTGITIKEDGCNIAPTIYVNSGFDKYQDGTPVEFIIDDYLRTYRNSKPSANFSVDFFTDFEQAKDRLTMKLVNAEKNSDLLAEVPHYLVGDLALLFQVQVEATELGNATITVRNEHSEMWNVDTEELFNQAKQNMLEKQPIRIQSMLEVLAEMMGDNIPAEMLASEPQMFVMSNATKVNAASGMIFTEKLQEFAELHNCNMFILPSSIHELLLVPDNGSIDVDNLSQMVHEVNTTQVSPEEVLSDTVYYYDKDARALMFAESKEILDIVAA